MPARKMPDYYRAPLRRRRGIASFLLSSYRQHTSQDYGMLLLTWDVKLYGLNLDFEHLLEVHRQDYNPDDYGEAWLAAARDLYESQDLNRLEEHAAEDARRHVNEDDTYKQLWDGTPLDVEYDFIGRSGGHIALTKFDGAELFTRGRPGGLLATATIGDLDLPFEDLRRLYRLVVMLDHDFTRGAARAEVEHQAAFLFFENRRDEISGRLNSMRSRPLLRLPEPVSIQRVIEREEASVTDLIARPDCTLQLVAGSHAKFWTVQVRARFCFVTWGRIGTRGQTQVKEFPISSQAREYANSKIAEKLAKGYREASWGRHSAAPSNMLALAEPGAASAPATQPQKSKSDRNTGQAPDRYLDLS